jgi:hypothetical protein
MSGMTSTQILIGPPSWPRILPSTPPDLIAALIAAVDETRAKKEQPLKKQKRLATAEA